MGKYRVLLLDADGTLFDYDKAERAALREVLTLYGLEFSDKALRQYRQINGELEKQMERGEISLNALRSRRFARFFDVMRIHCDPVEFDSLYVKELGKNAFLLDDAGLVCADLCKSVSLYIITNGIASSQRARLAQSGLLPFINGVFISEEIGFSKPHRYFFEYALARVDAPKGQVLIVGDSLSSDIAGGYASGVDTCWYNPKQNPDKGSLRPAYEITTLIELSDIIK